MFQEIRTKEQAKQFADFVLKEFKTISAFMDWLNPVFEKFGFENMTQYEVEYNDVTQHYLLLTINANKSIIFVGQQYEHDKNYITATIDFTEEQQSKKIFKELGCKIARVNYMYNQILSLKNNIHDLSQLLM